MPICFYIEKKDSSLAFIQVQQTALDLQKESKYHLEEIDEICNMLNKFSNISKLVMFPKQPLLGFIFVQQRGQT